MRVLFSPEFHGHVYLGLNEEHTHLMDAMVCDTSRLIGLLELRLGIHVEEHPSYYRTVKYFKAMSEYMKQHPDNALAESFKLSNLGTAEQALRWRDHLILDKWIPTEGTSGRLDSLVGTEHLFDNPGMPDRLKTVLQYIKKEKDLFSDLDIELPCEVDKLHPSIKELMYALKQCGTKLSIRQHCEQGDNNLSKVAKLLQSTSKENITLDKDDQSFLIYKFEDENAANEYFAYKGEELNADVWINNKNKSMDNWLRLMGKPTMGSYMVASSPQLLQLFVLGIDMMKEPLNIQSLISWLYSPMQPLGTFFGNILADNIINEGGYRNEKCRKIVADYISGKYTYHDKDEDSQLTDKEIAKRDAREEKERQILIKTYLPPFDVANDNEIDTQRLISYLKSLSDWARNRKHFLYENQNNEGWCNQLESLAQMCETFVLLVETSDVKDHIDIKQLDSWISTLYKGESFMQYSAQKGSIELIDNPAKMAAHSKRTIWMNFVGGDEKHLDCSFLYPTEKERIKDKLRIWNERDELDYNQAMQQLPFFMTEEQIILVLTDVVGGETMPKHPILVQLETRVENLDDFIVMPNLFEETTERVNMVSNTNIHSLIEFDHADLMHFPDHMSPTAMSTLVDYPLDFLMERVLKIVNTGPGSIKDVKTTKGTVAHAVIENLFAPRDEKKYSTASEIEQRINNEFDKHFKNNIEAYGAILDLPENRLDSELLKEQLRKCLDVLVEIIRENNLTVTGCERQVKTDMGLIDNSKQWDMIGYIDMTLEDEQQHPVVFDFKWTSSKAYYHDLLAANRSTQLELYRAMLGAEKHNVVKRTAYFLMPEGHLYSKEYFAGVHCSQIAPENNDNIVEQLRNSFFYRKKQLEEGKVEVGEAFPIAVLDYYKDTEEKNLFPLSKDETGSVKANIFSNYRLFKGLKEGEQ
jgi:hypothetical protein